jgi:sulfur-oxidizing protein SoxB
MVRTGGLGFTIDIAKPAGQRISAMTHLKTGAAIEASKEYRVAGWASIAETVDGPPIWDVIANYLKTATPVRVEETSAVKIVGA